MESFPLKKLRIYGNLELYENVFIYTYTYIIYIYNIYVIYIDIYLFKIRVDQY